MSAYPTVMPVIPHYLSPNLFHFDEKGLAFVGRRICMPRWIATAPLLKSGRIPFRIRNYTRSALLVGGRCIDHLEIFLKRLIDHIAAVGIGEPLAESGRVWKQVSHAGVCEG